MRDEYTRTIEPARALAAETLKLERTLSELVNQAYALTPSEIALMWQTAPPRMPIPSPGVKEPPPPANDPALGEHCQKTGNAPLLTPSAKPGRMGPQ